MADRQLRPVQSEDIPAITTVSRVQLSPGGASRRGCASSGKSFAHSTG